MNKLSPLLVRADASTAIGSGHVMRCLALAKAWQSIGGRVSYLMAESIPELEERLTRDNIQHESLAAKPGTVEDAEQTAACARRLGAAWVVVDGYRFGPNYIRSLKASGARVLALDDGARFDSYEADVVLNQNIGATAEKYVKCEAYTRLLLGSNYVLLRSEFTAEKRRREIASEARKLLVTMGGSDSENATSKVIRALDRVASDLEATIVVGGGNPHYEMLRALVQNLSNKIRLERNPSNMAPLMRWADLAISAAGGTCWELAFLGVPTILIVLSSDQTANASALAEHGAALSLGWHATLAEDKIGEVLKSLMHDGSARRVMSECGQKLIDGQGAARVVDFLQNSL